MTWPLISGGVSEKGDFAKRQLLKDGVWTIGIYSNAYFLTSFFGFHYHNSFKNSNLYIIFFFIL